MTFSYCWGKKRKQTKFNYIDYDLCVLLYVYIRGTFTLTLDSTPKKTADDAPWVFCECHFKACGCR